MPAGQLQAVTANPSQILNPFGTSKSPTLIENLPGSTPGNSFSIDLCWNPTFSPSNTYTLPPGDTYAWPTDVPLFARISPSENPNGNSVDVWVQPEGTGQSSAYTNAILTSIDAGLLPLPTVIATSNVNPPAPNSVANPLYVQTVPALALAREFTLANPARGASSPYILPAPGKITLLTGNLVCGTETNERQLFLTILYSPVGVIPYQYIIGQTTQNITFVGALGIYHTLLGSVVNFTLPDIFLPAGSKASINVVGMNDDDYLDDIDFVLSAA